MSILDAVNKYSRLDFALSQLELKYLIKNKTFLAEGCGSPNRQPGRWSPRGGEGKSPPPAVRDRYRGSQQAAGECDLNLSGPEGICHPRT